MDIAIEADAPSFEAAEPNNISTASSGDQVFSIEITDVGEAGVAASVADTTSPASEVTFILHDTQSPPSAGAAAFTEPNREFEVTADSITEALGIFTATLALNSQNLLLANMNIPQGFVTTVFWWVEAEFSVFQSTQKGTVLMGGRFGCNWDRIGANGLRWVRTSHLW